MPIYAIPPSGPTKEKVAWAETCFQEYGDALLKDKTITMLLEKLQKAIAASHQTMDNAGIVHLCAECENREGGSCCGAGIENKYDGWLLLINLLLGHTLPKNRRDQKSCFFLGHSGCMLLARHVICVNFLCNKVTESVDRRKIETMREKEGEELGILFRLNEAVKKRMRNLAQ